MKIIVCLTGATGVIYGIRLLEVLRETTHKVGLVLSHWAEKTIEIETEYQINEVLQLADNIYDYNDLAAPISSGSYQVDATVIVPCSMKTLASIAHGYAENLISRVADVSLKEKRKLILVTRETPLNLIHLENMRKVTLTGAMILPPMPSFYHGPKNIDEIINQTVGKILDNLEIPHNLFNRWKGEQV